MINEKLWKKYKKTNNILLRNKIANEYLNFINIIARKIYNKKSDLEYYDIYNYGVIGLLDAIEKFSIEKNKDFKTYAYFRIKGAIYDGIRKFDWIPRSVRKQTKNISKIINKDVNEINKTDYNYLKNRLNISNIYLDKMLYNNYKSNLLSLDKEVIIDFGESITLKDFIESNELDCIEIIYNNNLNNSIKNFILNLPEQQKKVIIYYYYENLSFDDMSKILNVNQSRVSQIHKQAKENLKFKLNKFIN